MGGVALNSTQQLLAKMAEALEQHGITIYCPWDGDLDSEELERYEGLVAVLDVVQAATNVPLLPELKAAVGYMRNAKIDLETGATKATAIRTIEGGIKRAEEALAKVEAGR